MQSSLGGEGENVPKEASKPLRSRSKGSTAWYNLHLLF